MSRISNEVKARVRAQAGNQCGYCRSAQRYLLGVLEIDHIIPQAHGGTDNEENLWLACRLCNGFKGAQIQAYDPITEVYAPLFNPRSQVWSTHFRWSEDGLEIIGRTPCGRATVVALQLNHIIAVTVRREWVAAGWHPPE
jgi:hypothetical protein